MRTYICPYTYMCPYTHTYAHACTCTRRRTQAQSDNRCAQCNHVVTHTPTYLHYHSEIDQLTSTQPPQRAHTNNEQCNKHGDVQCRCTMARAPPRAQNRAHKRTHPHAGLNRQTKMQTRRDTNAYARPQGFPDANAHAQSNICTHTHRYTHVCRDLADP